MHISTPRWLSILCATGLAVALGISALGPAPPPSDAQQSPSAAEPGRARPSHRLPAPFEYVVPPTTISPDVGAVSGDEPPFFREPFLIVNELGMTAAFMETPVGNPVGRVGWSCTSENGREWECGSLSKIGAPDDFHDFADPWLADTRGDPCPTYGSGITLAALESEARFTADGAVEERLEENNNRARTVAYHSTDMGRTWSGPEIIPEPAFDSGPDGSKVLFNDRTFVAYRTFVETGQYVSRLGTDADPCAFSDPLKVLEANDHPRLTATAEEGGFAMRTVAPGSTAGGSTLMFNSFGPQFETRLRDVPMAATVPPSLIQAFCTSSLSCQTSTDVGQTLLYDPVRERYHHVYTDRPVAGEGNALEDLVTRYNFSDDGGLTWSMPVKVAGSGAEFSEVGASSLEPTLARDPVTEQVLLAYYEKPTKDSLVVELRVRVLQDDGTWTVPVAVDETPYRREPSRETGADGNNGEARFGDYFGFQACGGVFHVAHHPIENGIGSIAYAAVRYDEAAPPAAESARRCPGLVSGGRPDQPDEGEPPDDEPGNGDDSGEGDGPGEGDEPGDGDGPGEDGRGEGDGSAEQARRVGGESRLATAVALSQEAFATAETAVLARADDFPDALAASGLAAELDAPVLLTPTTGLDDAVAEELRRLQASQVYLMGGVEALSEQVEADLDALGLAQTRIGGAERFETAALIAEEVIALGGPVEQAIVALGSRPDGRDAWPDALASGNLAATARAPILLTRPDRLPEVTADTLQRLLEDGETVFIAGGTDAVGDAPQQRLAETGYQIQRLAGADRYATAVAVTEEARRQGADAEPTVLASGEVFADALVAAPAARKLGGLMLLVAPDDIDDSPATRDFLDANAATIDTALIAGGTETISRRVLDQTRALITDDQ